MTLYVHTQNGLVGTVDLFTDGDVEARKHDGTYPWGMGESLVRQAADLLEQSTGERPSTTQLREELAQYGNGYLVVRDHELSQDEHRELFDTAPPAGSYEWQA